MSLTPSTITPARGAKKKRFIVGRGDASGRGKTSGRGGKGQSARSGGSKRNAIRAFKRNLQKVPKLRGFVSQKKKAETITLAMLNALAKNGMTVVTLASLRDSGVINKRDTAKIVTTGEISVAVTVTGVPTTATAKAAIEKAGGSVQS